MAGEVERATIPLECDAPAAVQLPPEVTTAATAEDEAETAEALNARRQRSELRVRRALAPYSLLVIGPAAADRSVCVGGGEGRDAGWWVKMGYGCWVVGYDELGTREGTKVRGDANIGDSTLCSMIYRRHTVGTL